MATHAQVTGPAFAAPQSRPSIRIRRYSELEPSRPTSRSIRAVPPHGIDVDETEFGIHFIRIKDAGKGNTNLNDAFAWVEFGVKETQFITVRLYNASCQRLQTLFEGECPGAELQQVPLFRDGLEGGLYVVRIMGESFSADKHVLFA